MYALGGAAILSQTISQIEANGGRLVMPGSFGRRPLDFRSILTKLNTHQMMTIGMAIGIIAGQCLTFLGLWERRDLTNAGVSRKSLGHPTPKAGRGKSWQSIEVEKVGIWAFISSKPEVMLTSRALSLNGPFK